MTLRNNRDARKQLGQSVSFLYNTLDHYGKEPEQIEDVVKFWAHKLRDFTWEQVSAALHYYTDHYGNFPTPNKIREIIVRGNKPPFSEAVYVSISKKAAHERSTAEWEYMRDYEYWIKTGRME